MKLSDAGYDFIRSWEQFRPTAYKPTKNDVWTIGFGHTSGVKEDDCCTHQDGLDWLHADVAQKESAVNRLVTVPLTQAQFDALVSFVFNLRNGEVQFEESTMRRKLNDRDYGGAAGEFMRWVHQGKDVIVTGLVRRRAAERVMFETGVYHNNV